MRCVITSHHPTLSKEEKERRVEQIKKRTIEYMKEVQDEKKKNRND